MQAYVTQRSSVPAADAGLLSELMELAWPRRCVGCERLGVLLCERCEAAAPVIATERACPRCGAPYGVLICTECYATDGPLPLSFSAAVSAYQFSGVAARLVTIYKDQHERRLAALCAERLARAIPRQWLGWADLLAYIPADRAKIRARGFDHMRLVAEHLTTLTGLEVCACLQKKGGEDQRALNREQRLRNLAGMLECVCPERVSGRRILLIDDVITTTATVEAASAVLIGAGAREVRVASVCRVY
ncbi:MAG: ComF family protein [Coriobacteriales bacterium]|jgi:ComF family protein|nr:ComF family protein [Coriobacteriales bacterium]